jgi:hypothetical protein
MELVQGLQQILSIAGGWLALSVLSWALFYPLLRTASRSDAAMSREAAEAMAMAETPAEATPAGHLALGRPPRSGSSPGRS